MRTLRLFQGMNEGEKYVLRAREEIPCPLNSVIKENDLLCQGYMGIVVLLTLKRRKKKQKIAL